MIMRLMRPHYFKVDAACGGVSPLLSKQFWPNL